MVKVYYHWQISQFWIHFWAPFLKLLKNMYLMWIASVDKKVEESRKFDIVYSCKFVHSGRLRAPAVHGVSSFYKKS